jgi:hypothetical protein
MEAKAGDSSAAARFGRVVAAAGVHSVRQGLWCEALRSREPPEAARMVDIAVRRARGGAEGLAVYLPLVDYRTLREKVGEARLQAVREAARAEGCDAALLPLEDLGPPGGPDRIGPPPDPICDRMTLGHRKAAARGMRSPLLERLLKDPDPRVVAQALRNPRLVEREVVSIASRRPCPEDVFHHLAASPRWIARAAVQRAVTLNPYAPPRLAAALLVCLPGEDLLEIAKTKGLHPAVRCGALEVRRW